MTLFQNDIRMVECADGNWRWRLPDGRLLKTWEEADDDDVVMPFGPYPGMTKRDSQEIIDWLKNAAEAAEDNQS